LAIIGEIQSREPPVWITGEKWLFVFFVVLLSRACLHFLLRFKTFGSSEAEPGLPDGLFSNQKIPIWVNFGGSCNGLVHFMGLFYDYWVYFVAIWHISHMYGHLVYFFPFWYVLLRQIWQL
jgi:hypothetical protein